MKNLSFLFISILALTLFSCRKEESKLTNGLLTITAIQKSDPGLKTNIGAAGTTAVTWNANDQLALFDGAGNVNKPFALSSPADSKWATFTGTIDNWSAGSKTFYAVYPYKDANGSAVHTAYPITIPQTQVQDFTSGNTYKHLGLYDYIAAPPKTIEYAGKSTLADNFNFEHLMAVLDIEVTNTTGGDIKVLQIRMKRSGNDFTTTASLNLTLSPGEGGFYAPSTYTNQLILSVQNAGTTANTLKFTGSMIIAPVVLANLTNTDFEVSVLNASGQGELYTVTKTTGLSILAGERYTAKITISSPTLLTYDSKDYRLTGIGTQVWMAENLAYLPSVYPPLTTSNTDPYYYVFEYSGTDVPTAKAKPNYATYGVLYNWPAAMNGAASSTLVPSGVQGICPPDWHLPSNAEWKLLTDYLTNNGYGFEGSGNDIGKSMAATSGWTTFALPGRIGHDQTSNNSSGFTALPGGSSYSGAFYDLGNTANFWSALEDGTRNAWLRSHYYYASGVSSNFSNRYFGFSVRCLRNN